MSWADFVMFVARASSSSFSMYPSHNSTKSKLYGKSKTLDFPYFAYFPELPDAFTQGKTLKEVALNAIETLALALADHIEDSTEPPAPAFGHAHSNDATLLLVATEISESDVKRMGAVNSTEAARMLGVTKGRVAQLVSRGQLESVGKTTERLISLRSINDRLAACRTPGRPRRAVGISENQSAATGALRVRGV
jgi:predicted RNase H-like HicB family nuclease